MEFRNNNQLSTLAGIANNIKTIDVILKQKTYPARTIIPIKNSSPPWLIDYGKKRPILGLDLTILGGIFMFHEEVKQSNKDYNLRRFQNINLED